jgi:hypothetical protein
LATFIETWLHRDTTLVELPTVPFVRHATSTQTFIAAVLLDETTIYGTSSRVLSAAPPAKGIAVAPYAGPYLVTVPYIRHTPSQVTWVAAVLLPYEEEEEVETRAAEDYLTRFYFGLTPVERTVIYTIPDDVDYASIRQISAANITDEDATISLWIAGYLFIPTLTVPAEEPPVGEDYPILTLRAGEVIEAQASVVGVNLFIDGIESVR